MIRDQVHWINDCPEKLSKKTLIVESSQNTKPRKKQTQTSFDATRAENSTVCPDDLKLRAERAKQQVQRLRAARAVSFAAAKQVVEDRPPPVEFATALLEASSQSAPHRSPDGTVKPPIVAELQKTVASENKRLSRAQKTLLEAQKTLEIVDEKLHKQSARKGTDSDSSSDSSGDRSGRKHKHVRERERGRGRRKESRTLSRDRDRNRSRRSDRDRTRRFKRSRSRGRRSMSSGPAKRTKTELRSAAEAKARAAAEVLAAQSLVAHSTHCVAAAAAAVATAKALEAESNAKEAMEKTKNADAATAAAAVAAADFFADSLPLLHEEPPLAPPSATVPGGASDSNETPASLRARLKAMLT